MELAFPIPITKMNGAGNDFIIIDHRSLFIPEHYHSQLAQAICRYGFSVGADGLILIEDSSSADFRWRFYNRDGSIAEMCGNGARCAARYAYRHKIAGREMAFETVAGLIKAEVVGEQEHVNIQMTDPFSLEDRGVINCEDKELELDFVNTGVPHAVIFVNDKDVPVKEWGRLIRYHEMFEPAGTNVNFVQVNDDGGLYVRTYERGVESETMACGTGVVASAIVATKKGKVDPPVFVTTTGGEQLVVDFTRDNNNFLDVFLQGAARIIFEGNLLPEALL